MDYEGMVHALQEAHRLLKPQGTLVDIHPLPEPPELNVLEGAKVLFSEAWPSQWAEDYRMADRAIELSLKENLFAHRQRRKFDFLTYASTASELQAFFRMTNAFDQGPRDPTVEEREADLIERVDRLLKRTSATARVAFNERASITSLAPGR